MPCMCIVSYRLRAVPSTPSTSSTQQKSHSPNTIKHTQPLPSPPPGASTGASFLPSATSYLGPLLLHPVQQKLLAPRDLCLLRYWRLDDDGVYTVCLTSVKHDKCPEQPGVVRGALNGVLSIAPRKVSFRPPVGRLVGGLIVDC